MNESSTALVLILGAIVGALCLAVLELLYLFIGSADFACRSALYSAINTIF